MMIASTLFVILVTLSFSSTVSSATIGSYREVLALDTYRMMCSPTTPCTYAVCIWRQDLLNPDDTCSYFLTRCQCPQGSQCAQTDPSIAAATEAAFSVFEYHCG